MADHPLSAVGSTSRSVWRGLQRSSSAALTRRPEWSKATTFGTGVAMVFIAVVMLLAVAAPLVAPHDPVDAELANSMRPPMWIEGGSATYPLGTDGFGRDVLSRLIYGARISLAVSAIALVIGLAVGGFVGLLAGYAGGRIDAVLMRTVDIVMSFPLIVIALALAVAIGPSFFNVAFVIGLLVWPRIARQVRGDCLVVKQQEFVRYATAVGIRGRTIARRHLLPNIMPGILMVSTLEVGHVILVEASLSFLGAGVPPPEPSWGVSVSDGRGLIATGWWISLFPGLAILLTVLAINVVGDWFRDYLDPRTRSR